ncbi:MAG: transporter permease [Verrucomicrobiales bacterium]|jgi:phospholipid/cholesterol/gamma-HCH transport system permease protein|nr:transporter permease [Verrucomicrobiales bacterium]
MHVADENKATPATAVTIVRPSVRRVGRGILKLTDTIHGLVAFSLITFGVIVKKHDHSRKLIVPLIREHVFKAGVKLLPMITLLGFVLGFVIIGQTVSLLNRVGAQNYLGMVMVTVVVRELGPMLTALVILARVGTAHVVELGASRAFGEVEALEALSIDPIHYLVVPRVIGISVSLFACAIYLILVSLLSGYLFAFFQNIPLRPEEYFNQLAGALGWEDFLFIGMKTILYGIIIAMVSCYQGLAHPLKIEHVPSIATRAVTQSIIGCVLLDAVFIVFYLLLR